MVRRSFFEFVQEMLEFIFQLFIRKKDTGRGLVLAGRNFIQVKAVASADGFVMDGFQVGVHRLDRMGCFPESEKLGMMYVAFCLSHEHFPGQQAFPPQGNQADGVQVGRVEGPESHGSLDHERKLCVDFLCVR